MRVKRIITGVLFALFFAHCTSEPSIKMDATKFSVLKKIALVETIIEEPRIGADNNNNNWLIALMVDSAKKDFLAQKAYIETAHVQLANALASSFANEISKEYKLTTMTGTKFTASKEYAGLTKVVPIVQLDSSSETIRTQLGTGEQNFFRPMPGDFGEELGLRFNRVFLQEKPLVEAQKMSEMLKVDGVAFVTVSPKVTVYSNVKYADAQIDFFIFDKTGTRVYQGSTFVRQKLEQGAGDMVSYKAMLDQVIASPATMLANYKAELQKK